MSVGAFWRYFKHAARQFSADNCPQLAAAISYYVLFSIVPLTFVLVSIFGIVIRDARLRSEVVQRVVDSIGIEKGNVSLALDEGKRDNLPPEEAARINAAIATMSNDQRQEIADELNVEGRAQVAGVTVSENDLLVSYDNVVSDALSGVARAGASITALSLLFGAWSASAMFGAVRKALNIIWKGPVRQAYLQQKLIDLAMVTAFGLLAIASVGGTAVIRALREASDNALGPLSSGTGLFWGIVPYVLPGLVSFVVFASLYRLVPSVPVRLRDVWFGALAALLFELLKNGFAIYVANFNSYNVLYGSLGDPAVPDRRLHGLLHSAFWRRACGCPAGLRAGVFAPDSNRPKVRLIDEIRREGVNALRALVWMPKRHQSEGEATRANPNQPRP
jgi:YihY family inner membrane protein